MDILLTVKFSIDISCTMSVSNVTGFETNEVLFLKKVSGTGFNTEFVLVNSSSRDGTNDNDLTGRIMVTRGYGTSETYNAKHSGSISEVANSATTYEPGQVIVSTGKQDTGYITNFFINNKKFV